MAVLQSLLLLLVIRSVAATGKGATCSPYTVKFDSDKIVLAAVGDWGRVGAEQSFFNPATVAACAKNRQCCSSLQRDQFPPDFDESDFDDAPQQLRAASLLNEICGKAGCQAVIGLGDNYYPCGADDYKTSGLNRFESDWEKVYLTQPHLKHLKWYQIVGNHDYGFDGSRARQVAYTKINKQWVMPEPYYATRFEGKDFSFQIHALDAAPFVQSYAYPDPNYSYYHSEYIASATPDYINTDARDYYNKTNGLCTIPPNDAEFITKISDTATGQIPWLKSCLESSSATWNAIQGHFALWGSDQLYGDPKAAKYYPGMCGAWASVQALVDKYKPAFYINGHDHTMTHSDPKHAGTASGKTLGIGSKKYVVDQKGATQYFTFGNGASVAYGDGVTPGSPKKSNDFSSVIYNNNVDGAPGEGFGIITITKCDITVDFYSYIDYEREEKPVHTVYIPGNC